MVSRSIKRSKSFNITDWMNVLALALWSTLMLKYLLTGEISLLVHPRYYPVVLGTSVALGAITVFSTWGLLQKATTPKAQHTNYLPSGWTVWILVCTAIIGLVTSPKALGSEAAARQGITDSFISTRIQPATFRFSSRLENRTLVEWATTLMVYPEPDRYIGQKISVEGFVVHSPKLSDQYFILTRFVIMHCALDAFPIALPVQLTESLQRYPPDTWLKVQGEIIAETLEGQRQIVIQAHSLSTIPEPKNPYAY